jgi:hypothetical protein
MRVAGNDTHNIFGQECFMAGKAFPQHGIVWGWQAAQHEQDRPVHTRFRHLQLRLI